MFRLLLALVLIPVLFLSSCKGKELKSDPYPATMDGNVYQTRLEFKGCGHESLVGSIVCFPKHKSLQIRTDFPGVVTLVSKGEGCGRQLDLKATQPYTTITLPERSKSCSSSILYQPKFVPEPDMEIRGIFGELIQFPLDSYTYLGTRAYSLYEEPLLQLPSEIVRGGYWNRSMTEPKAFNGSVVSYRISGLGTDLVQVKGFDKDNVPSYYLYTVNYYSPQAKNLSVTITESSGEKVLISLPEEVSVVSIEGDLQNWRSFKMDRKWIGVIRAYTVKGRTLVFKFNKGEVEWKQ